MHFLYVFPFLHSLYSVMHLFLSHLLLTLSSTPLSKPLVNFNIFNSVHLLEKLIVLFFPTQNYVVKRTYKPMGVKVSAEKDLIKKLSANTYKMSNKKQLLIKLKYYYFFSFWAIMLLLLINACTKTLVFFPYCYGFCHL